MPVFVKSIDLHDGDNLIPNDEAKLHLGVIGLIDGKTGKVVLSSIHLPLDGMGNDGIKFNRRPIMANKSQFMTYNRHRSPSGDVVQMFHNNRIDFADVQIPDGMSGRGRLGPFERFEISVRIPLDGMVCNFVQNNLRPTSEVNFQINHKLLLQAKGGNLHATTTTTGHIMGIRFPDVNTPRSGICHRQGLYRHIQIHHPTIGVTNGHIRT